MQSHRIIKIAAVAVEWQDHGGRRHSMTARRSDEREVFAEIMRGCRSADEVPVIMTRPTTVPFELACHIGRAA